MKKQAISLVFGLLMPLAPALAQIPVNVNANTNAQGQAGKSAASTSEGVGIGRNAEARATSTEPKKKNASTTASVQGKFTAETHRSAVASLVASLLADAERDGGIGAEVRAVAQSQKDSAPTISAAMKKVEERSALKTFFLGTDWKNTGALRSEIAKTDADIDRLEAALDRATDDSVKEDLALQIEALKDARANIETFVEAHEGTFSLFGWFTKLFS